jgi:FkbM family methyltransferase
MNICSQMQEEQAFVSKNANLQIPIYRMGGSNCLSQNRSTRAGRSLSRPEYTTMPNPLLWLRPKNARFLVRALKARFRDQKAEFAIIQRHVRSGDIVCDIGANKGSFVLWLSRWCQNGTVVAFEPQPLLARSLAEICGRLGLSNVKVEARAVYSRSGSIELFVPNDSPGASLIGKFRSTDDYKVVSVPMVTLDDYFDRGTRVTLLKIDVEGAELEVFKGAERILREQSPLLVFECENRHLEVGIVQDVFFYLRSLGYEGSFVCRNTLLPLSAFDPLVHQRQVGGWFWKKEGYCNNFVFAKSPVCCSIHC